MYLFSTEMAWKCKNCNLSLTSSSTLCKYCQPLHKCCRCQRHLSDNCFADSTDTFCITCTNRTTTRRSALNEYIHEVNFDTSINNINYETFISSNASEILRTISTALDEYPAVKLYFRSDAYFERYTMDGSLQSTTAGFQTTPTIISSTSDIDIQDLINRFVGCVEGFNARGSSWQLSSVTSFSLSYGGYRPMVGSSYVPTPELLAGRKAILNIKNLNDNYCFLYSILASLHPVRANQHNVYSYKKYLSELNYEGLEFPLKVTDIPKFEQLNQFLSVNVIVYDEEEEDFFPIYQSPNRTRQHHVNLLLLTSYPNSDQSHYTLIRSLSRLVSHRTKHDGRTYVCEYCLHPFELEKSLEKHLPNCRIHKPQTVEMPKHTSMKFKNYNKQFEAGFCLYYDFESFLMESNDSSVKHEHIPSGFCIYRTSQWSQYEKEPFVYSGPDVMDVFYNQLMKEQAEINQILSQNIPMKSLSPSEHLDHQMSTRCMVCKGRFTSDNRRTHHHDHITGCYIGAVCNLCNLQLKYRKKHHEYSTPVLAHNASRYDLHHVLKYFTKKVVDVNEINIIANTSEKYTTIGFKSLRFLDTVQFLPASLENLVDVLMKNGKQVFAHTLKYMGDSDLVFCKGVYPYEYMNSAERFNETSLPTSDKFYSALNEQSIDDADYLRAQRVWSHFNCKTMKDYHDVYLKMDVLLLADIFENFRKLGITNFGLDPAHYITLPSYAWDACLKKTEVELELFTDPDMYLFIENNIRGGISMISHRYAKSNNPYLEDVEEYNPDDPLSYITYLDCTNLYGTSMLRPLPTSEFVFLTETEVNELNIETHSVNDEYGFILEVDLEYPPELHDMHNDYPLAPQKLTITTDMLSPYAKLFNVHNKSEKLVPNLLNKSRYVVHYTTLQLYIKLGLKLTKIHRVLKFRQHPWLKPYVEHCTENRKAAKSDFEKDFWKLCVNAVYGKSMENVRRRCNYRLITDEKKAMKVIAKPIFKGFKIINEDLILIESMKKTVVLEKPVYSGFVILDVAKELMYNFHYNHIVPKYGMSAQLLFTDTDSLCYHITTKDLYSDMKQNLDLYDTANFAKDHPLYSVKNNKVLGKFKSETAEKAPLEFVGLRPKMYSLLVSKKEKPKMTAKGIKRGFVSKHVRHGQFLNTLRTKLATKANFLQFRSTNHVIKTLEVEKLCLAAFDNKRYLLDDGIRSLAYGHFRIPRV